MAKVRVLTDEELKRSIQTKYREANQKREPLVIEWDICKYAYQCISEGPKGARDSGLAQQAYFTFGQGDEEYQMPLLEGLDTAKAVLFLHAKLCISDPTLSVTPRKQDPGNKRAAAYAQGFLDYIRKRTKLQEKTESGSYLNVVVPGTGITYFGWNKDGGDLPKANSEIPSETTPGQEIEFEMEGDYDMRNVSPYRFWIDATAEHWDDANYCIEETELPIEVALSDYSDPEQQELIRQAQQALENEKVDNDKTETKGSVKLYHYWERGRPWNGFLGAHVVFLKPEDPQILYRGPNPYSHKQLPYSIMTDIDIPGSPWGMSRIIYAFQVQMSINNLITLIMDNISLFGGTKMLAPAGSINDEAMNNSRDDIAFYDPASGGKVEHIRPGNVTTDVWRTYDILKGYINNVYGMNEFSQGQIPRELSSYAVQLALEMDDKYRIRLFNKKKSYLKDIYEKGLSISKQYLDDDRRVSIVGVEGYPDEPYFKMANLEGEYDVEVDYGPYMPVDPAARKQQLLEFLKSGYYEKAGGNMRKVAKLLIDGSMLDIKQDFEKSFKRQQVEIDKIIKGEKISIEEWDDHVEHAAAVEDFSRTETFEALPREVKNAIWEHGKEHVKAKAKQIAESGGPQGAPQPGAGGAPPPPGAGAPPPPPAGGMPPPPPSGMDMGGTPPPMM
jgi:hypothetical protein